MQTLSYQTTWPKKMWFIACIILAWLVQVYNRLKLSPQCVRVEWWLQIYRKIRFVYSNRVDSKFVRKPLLAIVQMDATWYRVLQELTCWSVINSRTLQTFHWSGIPSTIRPDRKQALMAGSDSVTVQVFPLYIWNPKKYFPLASSTTWREHFVIFVRIFRVLRMYLVD